ncbi:hypothetical protein EXIGLDRAFT_695354 [Exidia glandulosa HHB12029]|uniref:Uncharacterized protein n=1 Tax=Exidia glandulosa HHB12029 TaxID=1314781 RepID=A0A165FZ42_EXIGL|nr:hypothetical protein EXIGLDRAFT_695354 [Exidia glandulosa HHB12029]
MNNESAKEYEERPYRDTGLASNTLPQYTYDYSAGACLVILRTQQSQKKDARVAEQLKARGVVLNPFGVTSRLNNCTSATRPASANPSDPSDYALLALNATYYPEDRSATIRPRRRSSGRRLGRSGSSPSTYRSYSTCSSPFCCPTTSNSPALQFAGPTALDKSARVANFPVLNANCHPVGVTPDDLVQAETTRTSYLEREMYVFLGAERSPTQFDRRAMDFYAILFAFVTVLANHKTEPAVEQLVQQHGQNGFDKLAVHFCDELVQGRGFARVLDE